MADALNGWLFSSQYCTADHVTLSIISCLLGIQNADDEAEDDENDCRVWFIASLEDGGTNIRNIHDGGSRGIINSNRNQDHKCVGGGQYIF